MRSDFDLAASMQSATRLLHLLHFDGLGEVPSSEGGRDICKVTLEQPQWLHKIDVVANGPDE